MRLHTILNDDHDGCKKNGLVIIKYRAFHFFSCFCFSYQWSENYDFFFCLFVCVLSTESGNQLIISIYLFIYYQFCLPIYKCIKRMNFRWNFYWSNCLERFPNHPSSPSIKNKMIVMLFQCRWFQLAAVWDDDVQKKKKNHLFTANKSFFLSVSHICHGQSERTNLIKKIMTRRQTQNMISCWHLDWKSICN